MPNWIEISQWVIEPYANLSYTLYPYKNLYWMFLFTSQTQSMSYLILEIIDKPIKLCSKAKTALTILSLWN